MLTYPRTDSRALPEDYLGGGQEDLRDDRRRGPAGPAARAGAARAQGAERGLRQADQARLRQRQGVGPLRDHPDAAGAEAA
ncbi:MAG: hypothetical protein MZW92_14330 [Comamonadaceae bacterium]|nr:hypothetical protein [Comamonadaceae bacterium]